MDGNTNSTILTTIQPTPIHKDLAAQPPNHPSNKILQTYLL